MHDVQNALILQKLLGIIVSAEIFLNILIISIELELIFNDPYNQYARLIVGMAFMCHSIIFLFTGYKIIERTKEYFNEYY